MRLWMIILVAVLWIPAAVTAQEQAAPHKSFNWLRTKNDSAYIDDYTRDVTFRLYGSRKYTNFDIVDTKRDKEILYRPNDNFNIGFGANYKFLGINIGFNLPFINKDDELYGRTRYLDLQTHVYLRKLVVDFYWQYYRGYYIAASENGLLSTAGINTEEGKPLMIRPDLHTRNYGLSMLYVFNDERFSYRAAYLQNDYQKKSAGSLILGGEIFSTKIDGDSSLIPTSLEEPDFFEGKRYDRSGIISVAATAGYAYTLVYKRHLFLTLSLSGGLGVNVTKLLMMDGGSSREGGWQLNNTVRASIGYNSDRYFAGIHYVNVVTRSETPVSNTYQTFGTGNFRISLVRRFTLKKPLF